MENNIQPPPHNPQSSIHFSKTFIILIVVIIIAAVGVGGYMLGIKQFQTMVHNANISSQSSTASDKITKPVKQTEGQIKVLQSQGTKTFTNIRYGYSFSYPPELTSYSKKDSDLVIFKSLYNKYTSYDINISVGVRKTGQSLEERINGDLNYSSFPSIKYFSIKREETTVAGVRAIRELGREESSYPQESLPTEHWQVMTLFQNESKTYLIQYSVDAIVIKDKSTGKLKTIHTQDELMENPPDLSAYNQILSTFKFLDTKNQLTQKCATYTRNGQKINACATCGNGICEPFETCTATNFKDGVPPLPECGPLFCGKDCQN